MSTTVFHDQSCVNDDKSLRFIVTARSATESPWTGDLVRRDMLVVPHFQDSILPVETLIDKALNGNLSKQLVKDGFTAKIGERRLYSLEQHGLGAEMPRYVLVVGLGPRSDTDASIFCGLVGTVIQESASALVDRVVIPLHGIDMASKPEHMASVLRCRTRSYMQATSELGQLNEIELVVDPTDEAAWLKGLQNTGPLCGFCSDPSL